jgi:hypothetical protein
LVFPKRFRKTKLGLILSQNPLEQAESELVGLENPRKAIFSSNVGSGVKKSHFSGGNHPQPAVPNGRCRSDGAGEL